MTKEQEEARDRLHALIPHLRLSEQLSFSPNDTSKAMLAILRVNPDNSGNIVCSWDMKALLKI